MDAVTQANREAWETASRKHVREYHDLLAQAAAGSSLNHVERGLLAGAREVVHLQSGHGLDDTALVQVGAKSVTGIDYSAVAAGAAQRRAGELGLPCWYVVGTVPGVPLDHGTRSSASRRSSPKDCSRCLLTRSPSAKGPAIRDMGHG